MAGGNKLLVYLLRRDIRATDNPIFHHLATADHGFTHVLPVYVLPPHQLEVSGLLKDSQKSPYPPAVSQVGKFWRCGPVRTKFIAESIWDLKTSLEELNSGMIIRVGSYSDVLTQLVGSLREQHQSIDSVWLTEEPSKEEVDDQKAISAVCSHHSINFKLWRDDKYFIDDRETGLDNPKDLPDVFTTYRKSQEPLKDRPQPALPRPQPGSLPTFPQSSWIATQDSPFIVPDTYKEFEDGLLKPIKDVLSNPPSYPKDAENAHPFKGGETTAWDRLHHLIKSGAMTAYQETRNGLIGQDYSTKLAAYLALGSISARSIHEEMAKLEDGTDQAYAWAKGFGRGENEGTRAMRLELLWRDYMRLCTMKFGSKLFKLGGFKGESKKDEKKWKSPEKTYNQDQDPSPEEVKNIIDRFLEGSTGMGLIDASQRELYHTGYTSNRARQNVASFFSKHLYIDWRYGAEWYEMMLVDYDVSSNWANWQYVAGVGNDPRGDARIFNPVKQAFDYDNNGAYVRMWVPEVKHIEKLENVFQVWTTDEDELQKYSIADNIMVTHPIKKIDFQLDRKPRTPRRPYRWRRGNGRGGNRRGGGGGGNGNGESNGRGNDHANANGNANGNGHRTSDYSNMVGGHSHGGPPSPESDRHFYNGDNGYHQNNLQHNGGWSQNRGGISWRGNPHSRGNMRPLRGNGYTREYASNNYGGPPRQYIPTPVYSHQQYPPPCHQKLPPHLGHAV